MSSWGKTNRGGDDTELDITPMIDVTFLLLIFFMVTSTMQANKDRDVPSARHGVGVDSRTAAMIDIRGEADNPELTLGGAAGTLEGVTPFVQERVDSGVTQIIIKAERTIRHGFVTEVAKRVVEVEGAEFDIGVRDPD